MELRASGEDYLEAVFVLGKRMGRVAPLMLANTWALQKQASAMDCGSCVKAVF